MISKILKRTAIHTKNTIIQPLLSQHIAVSFSSLHFATAALLSFSLSFSFPFSLCFSRPFFLFFRLHVQTFISLIKKTLKHAKKTSDVDFAAKIIRRKKQIAKQVTKKTKEHEQ